MMQVLVKYLRSHFGFEVKHFLDVAGALLPAADDLLAPHLGSDVSVDSCSTKTSLTLSQGETELIEMNPSKWLLMSGWTTYICLLYVIWKRP